MDSDEEWPCFYSDVDEARPDVAHYFNELSRNNHFVTAEDLSDALLENPEGIFLLDIREEEYYEREHIEGAVHIWWHDVGDRLEELPKDKPIVVVCNTGQSAAQLVGVLQSLGYRIYSLLGGMNNGWLPEGYPVITIQE